MLEMKVSFFASEQPILGKQRHLYGAEKMGVGARRGKNGGVLTPAGAHAHDIKIYDHATTRASNSACTVMMFHHYSSASAARSSRKHVIKWCSALLGCKMSVSKNGCFEIGENFVSP